MGIGVSWESCIRYGRFRNSVPVLDIDRTVESSARAGGHARVCFRNIGISSEFVVLVDRRSEQDHLAEFNLGIVRLLRDAGLFLEIWEFNSEPTVCQNPTSGEFLRTDALVQRFPDSIVLIFASAEQLAYQVVPKTSTMATAIANARSVVLVTPRWSDIEMSREREMAALVGVKVVPSSPDGIRSLIDVLVEARQPSSNKAQKAPFDRSQELLMEFLDERPQRWVRDLVPRWVDCQRAQELLNKAFDRNVLRWLGATAVYPELRWSLTNSLRTATNVQENASRRLDQEMLAVVRLPWFRAGWMPRWLRRMLRDALTAEDKALIRSVLIDALGLRNSRTEAYTVNDLEISYQQSRSRARVNVDGVLLEFLLPAVQSMGLASLPDEVKKHLLRGRIWKLLTLTGAAIALAIIFSLAALSFLPIDECDLIAASLLILCALGLERFHP